ncbi:unnamed protein product [Acanthoscelides obtectus]|uniref:Aladin seven-bladed propeller domain-containing protein n=1 Tax=Acanthoscelides obtectus TaxID=200917 RepID=A0A9P0Q5W3_ACAOB|nr:unnamed protein product [Acanthoscelides obtectus]CAK1677292.1 Aladin [Acanthoscelides obtectus]
MKGLHEFEVPNDGEICLCEINGRVHSVNYEYANLDAFTDALKNHPKIHITRDQLHLISSGDEGKALFLPVDVSFLKQLTQVYYEQGFTETLHTASGHNQWFIRKGSKLILDVLKYINKVRLIFNPNVRYSGPTLINEYAQGRNWLNSTIRCIAWHPYSSKVAIATCDDSIRIFSSECGSITPILRCKQQKHVTCIAWRPLSNTEIAVGHEDGIIIWNVDPNSLVVRPSISNAVVLKRLEHKPVISLAWSPRGDKLVTAAACDNTILVWDVELDLTSSLKRSGGSGNILVKWSPTGERLFSCSNTLVFRIWDCRTWDCERWSLPSMGRIQSACWAADGSVLLFAAEGDTVLYGAVIDCDIAFVSNGESLEKQACPLFDMSRVDVEGIPLGGPIRQIEADPKGRHVAVLFQDTDCIAVFGVVKRPQLALIPSSLIMGLAEEKPSTISFIQDFDSGSCLTIGWSSGRLQYYPIIYSDLGESHNKSVNCSYNSFNAKSIHGQGL